MIQKDLYAYAAASWSDFLRSVTELSESDNNGEPLVESSVQMYCFDSICEVLFPNGKIPTSADGIDVTPQFIRFVEFKSGFKKRITKENFNEEEGRCEATQTVCKVYWNLFFKEQEKETSELIASIRLKALESYLTLEKQLLPHCQDALEPIPVVFTAVIDGDAVENMMDTLAQVSGKRVVADTSIAKVRKALSRLAGIKDADGNDYCYDRIEVFSAQDYKNQLRQRS